MKLKSSKIRKGLIIQTDQGWGEIAPLPGFSIESFEEAKKEALAWIKQDKKPTLPSVRFGIECSRKSLQSINLPLSSLGPKVGFDTWKLKMGALSLNEGVNLVKTCLGKARLRLDFNKKWSLKDAVAFTKYFNSDDFEYLEEPTKDLKSFSEETGFPVAVDESIHIDWKTIPTLKAIVVKPTIVGYIPKVPSHLKLVLSSAYESGLGLLHIAHLAISDLPVGLDTHEAFSEDLLSSPLKTENGIFSWSAVHPYINQSKLCPVH